jgi:hypothetical protein
VSIRLGSKYFEILKYDLQLSKNWAQRALNSTGPERNKFRAEAKRGYESMLEQVAAAKLAPEEEAYLRNRLVELRKLLSARTRRHREPQPPCSTETL